MSKYSGRMDRPMQLKSQPRSWFQTCRRRSQAVLAIVMINLGLVGCLDSPLPTDEASLSATFRLDGNVTENNEGVEVILPGTAYRGYSDSEGRITFDHLPPRTYELLARKDGFNEFRERKITLESGDHIDLGVVHLAAIPRDGTLEGEVALQNLPEATLTVRLLGSSLAPIQSATNGYFRLTGIPAGKYRVSITHEGQAAGQPIPVTIEAGKTARLTRLSLSPGFSNLSPIPAEEIIDVTEEVPIDSLPTPVPTVPPAPQPEPTIDPNAPGIVKGYAFYPDRQDHSGILVRVVDPPLQAITDAAGLYLLSSVPPGMRTLRAEAEGYAPFEMVDLSVSPGELTQAPRIQLPVSGAAQDSSEVSRIYGQVLLADKGEQPGIPVALEGTNFTAITGRDGTFVFNSVPSGGYVVIASLEGYETFTEEVEVPESGEDVPVPVITLKPIAIYMAVLETNPRQNARKVPVTDRVHVEIRLSERFIPSALKGAVTVFPQVAARIESPEADLITVDLLRTEQPSVQFETSYTVTVGTSLVSTEGHRLERPFVLLFKTGGPRILGSRPAPGSRGIILAPDEPIWLDLNQPIDLRSLAEKIRISPNSGEIPVIRQERTLFGQRVEIQLQVPPKRKVRITIPSSIRTNEGQKYENTPYRIDFETGAFDELPNRTDEYLNEINDMLDY